MKFKFWVYFYAILIVIAIAGYMIFGVGETGPKGKTCKVCERTFKDAENMHSITLNNMCVQCYKNYNYAQSMLGN